MIGSIVLFKRYRNFDKRMILALCVSAFIGSWSDLAPDQVPYFVQQPVSSLRFESALPLLPLPRSHSHASTHPQGSDNAGCQWQAFHSSFFDWCDAVQSCPGGGSGGSSRQQQ
jgi:hypothetical protein